MLSQEQTQQVKAQLLQQIEANFPEDKKQEAKQQVETMSSEQLEVFLEKNKLTKNQSSGDQGCVFCSIVLGDTQSYKIDENNSAVAVLELNPISMGHTLIIPKKHVSSKKEIPKEVFSLAEKISKKIKTKLKPKKVETFPGNLFGHEIINLLPVYNNETPDSERAQAKPEEIEEVLKTIFKEKKKILKKLKTQKIKEKMWLPRRIP
jgi:diadenosine tetraphosphate (Ap4A) HIT family hydrolase